MTNVQVARILGCTRELGKAQGFIGLPIRDAISNSGLPVMQSVWTPSPDELAALNAGANVLLEVIGTAHPPVMLSVGETPSDT